MHCPERPHEVRYYNHLYSPSTRQHKKDIVYDIQEDSSSQLAHRSTVTIHVKHYHELYNFCSKEISALALGSVKLHNELFECLNLFKNLIFLRYIVSETTQLKYNKQHCNLAAIIIGNCALASFSLASLN